MAEVVTQEAPVSLYLKLEQGQHADLEVVAKAAIAFSKAVEELAYIIDPTMTVRVELESGSDGSLNLNNILKLIADIKASAEKNKGLKWLAILVAMRIANNTVDWTQERVMDWLATHDVAAIVKTLTQNEVRELADLAQRTKRAAQSEIQAIYREVERDTKIEGLGVALEPRTRPRHIVPRREFAERAGTSSEELTTGRVTTERVTAVLVSPVLVDAKRRWRFRVSGTEFGAVINDAKFLEDVLTGRLGAHLKAGIEIDMDLETTEELVDGVWKITQWRVMVVHGWKEPPTQGDLGLPPT